MAKTHTCIVCVHICMHVCVPVSACLWLLRLGKMILRNGSDNNHYGGTEGNENQRGCGKLGKLRGNTCLGAFLGKEWAIWYSDTWWDEQSSAERTLSRRTHVVARSICVLIFSYEALVFKVPKCIAGLCLVPLEPQKLGGILIHPVVLSSMEVGGTELEELDRKNESPLMWWPRKWEKRKSPGLTAHGEEDKGRGRPSHLSGSRVSGLGDRVMNTHDKMQCVLTGATSRS